MTAVAARPMEATLTDALTAIGLHVRSLHAWHEEPTFWKSRQLRCDQWHFECRVAEDRGRSFSGSHETGWIDEAQIAIWFAERVKEMVARPGSYGPSFSGETQAPDGHWAKTQPTMSWSASFELTRMQRKQTNRRSA